jgi:hypothetical protein
MKERPRRDVIRTGDPLPSANTLVTPVPARGLLRLHSLAFGFGTFAYANGLIAKVLSSEKDRASSPRDGLLKDNPPPMPIKHFGSFNAGGGQL